MKPKNTTAAEDRLLDDMESKFSDVRDLVARLDDYACELAGIIKEQADTIEELTEQLRDAKENKQ